MNLLLILVNLLLWQIAFLKNHIIIVIMIDMIHHIFWLLLIHVE